MSSSGNHPYSSTSGNHPHDNKSMTENIKEKFEGTKDYIADKTQGAKESMKEGYDKMTHKTHEGADKTQQHALILTRRRRTRVRVTKRTCPT
jgi:hypothetical protein